MLTPKHRFLTLDGLRGVAAIAVVTRHTHELLWSITPAGFPGPLFESHLAVDFFFMLSGFVLAHAYWDKVATSMSTARFMIIRLIRLYPLYLFAFGVALIPNLYSTVLGHQAPSTFLIDTVSGLLFLPSPIDTTALFPFNGPAWSLFFELMANLIFALLALRIKRTLLPAIVVLSGICLGLSVARSLFGFSAPGAGAIQAGFQWSSFVAGCLRVSYSFFAGLLLYRFWSKWKRPVHIPPLIAMAALLAVLSAAPAPGLRWEYDLASIFIVFPLIIAGSASTRPGRYLTVPCMLLGLTSYGVYVLQVPVYDLTMFICYKLFGPTSMHQLSAVAGFCFICFLFLLALALDRYYDAPVRRMLSAKYNTVMSLSSIGLGTTLARGEASTNNRSKTLL